MDVLKVMCLLCVLGTSCAALAGPSGLDHQLLDDMEYVPRLSPAKRRAAKDQARSSEDLKQFLQHVDAESERPQRALSWEDGGKAWRLVTSHQKSKSKKKRAGTAAVATARTDQPQQQRQLVPFPVFVPQLLLPPPHPLLQRHWSPLLL